MATPATKDDISEEELKLLGAIRTLDVKPEGVDSKEGFESFLKKYEETFKGQTTEKRQTPRISTFFGEEGKGDVSYRTWRYEIECLLEERIYSEDVLLLAIRRSARGEAADILRRLGTKASVGDILKKFESTYGQIDNPETILKDFMPVKWSLMKLSPNMQHVFRNFLRRRWILMYSNRLT